MGEEKEATHPQPPVFVNQGAHGAVNRGPEQALPIEQMDRHGVCSILCSLTSQLFSNSQFACDYNTCGGSVGISTRVAESDEYTA